MDYVAHLRDQAAKHGSILSLSADPDLSFIPETGGVRESIASYYRELFQRVADQEATVSAVKPNIAFFEQYGIEGHLALRDVIAAAREIGRTVILDAKRGDIGVTSTAYARAVYDDLGVDSVTVAPYMGDDSVLPFIDHAGPGQGQYVLCRTSNPGAQSFQTRSLDGVPLFHRVAEKIVEWSKGSTGAVVGATSPGELEQLARYFGVSCKTVPLLIPGIGTQGGSAAEVADALRHADADLAIQRISVGSIATNAYRSEGTDDRIGAACRVIERIHAEVAFAG